MTKTQTTSKRDAAMAARRAAVLAQEATYRATVEAREGDYVQHEIDWTQVGAS